jgi:hypothetical protein
LPHSIWDIAAGALTSKKSEKRTIFYVHARDNLKKPDKEIVPM